MTPFWYAFWTVTVPQAIAWRLPRRVVYFAAIRLLAHATQGPWSAQVVPDLKLWEALARWEQQP